MIVDPTLQGTMASEGRESEFPPTGGARYFLHNYFQHLLIREYDHE